MKNRIILILFLSCICTLSFSQKEVRKAVKSGNKEYKLEKYTDAEIDYRKALEVNTQSVDAAYNLGNALYKQGKFPEAAEQYQAVISADKGKGQNDEDKKNKTDRNIINKDKLASAWHNMGNIFLNAGVSETNDISKSNEALQKSIAAFKNSLKNNPKDDETRYNLALAQKLLQDQQQQQDQQDKNDKNKDQQDKDKNKDQQDKDQNKDQNKDKDQQDKSNENENKQNKTQEQPQQNEQMSKDNAQQILDAMLQNEKDTQDKVLEAQKKQIQKRKIDKEW